MMDAQLWLLITKEHDTPALPPSPIAPSTVNFSVPRGAKVHIPIAPNIEFDGAAKLCTNL